MSEFVAGQQFRNDYPFVRYKYTAFDEDGEYEVPTWKPGVKFEASGYWGDETTVSAHGVGSQILTVIDVHKPGRFPERVFYTVKWVNPDGKEFGKGKLHIATTEKFRRLSKGFKWAYEIELVEEAA